MNSVSSDAGLTSSWLISSPIPLSNSVGAVTISVLVRSSEAAVTFTLRGVAAAPPKQD